VKADPMTSDILVTRTDRVLRIQLNRPEKKNALTGAMYDAMREAIAAEKIARDEAAYVAGRLAVNDATKVDAALADSEIARWPCGRHRHDNAASL